MEAFADRTGKVGKVIQGCLKEVIPKFGAYQSIHSNTRPTFISKMVYGISQRLGTRWTVQDGHSSPLANLKGPVTLKVSPATLCQKAAFAHCPDSHQG